MIKDLSGVPLLLQPNSTPLSSNFTASAADLAAYAAKTIKLVNDLSTLSRDYEDVIEDSTAAHLKLKSLNPWNPNLQ